MLYKDSDIFSDWSTVRDDWAQRWNQAFRNLLMNLVDWVKLCSLLIWWVHMREFLLIDQFIFNCFFKSSFDIIFSFFKVFLINFLIVWLWGTICLFLFRIQVVFTGRYVVLKIKNTDSCSFVCGLYDNFPKFLEIYQLFQYSWNVTWLACWCEIKISSWSYSALSPLVTKENPKKEVCNWSKNISSRRTSLG